VQRGRKSGVRSEAVTFLVRHLKLLGLLGG